MGLDAKACLHSIEWLSKRGELAELGAYLLAIDSWKDQKPSTPEHTVYAGALRAFQSLVWPKVKFVAGLIEEGQWASVECQRVHKQLVGCHPIFAKYDAKVYARVARGGDASPVDSDEEDEFAREWIEWSIDEDQSDKQGKGDLDGYYSDDSDEEFEEELLEVLEDPRDLTIEEFGFPESDRPSSRSRKKKWLHKRSGARSKLEARNEKAKRVRAFKTDVTFRYHGAEIEPEPYMLIGRVRKVRAKQSSSEVEQIEMAGIYHGPDEWTKQAEKDFKVARRAFAEGDVETLRGLKTKFCLAQYRGITYKTSTFDSRARQISRNEDERGRAIYSMSVLHEAGVAPTDYFRGNCSKQELESLDRIARGLKQVLLDKRETDEVRVGGIRFDNQADAIQHIYTNQYDYFHSSIARYLANKDEWRKDQEGGIAEVRESARHSPEAAKRTSRSAEYDSFVSQATVVHGLGADLAGYGRYLERTGLVADEPSFKRAAKEGTPLSTEFGVYQYDQYRRGKVVLRFIDYTQIHAEFGGYEANYEGWTQYVEDVGGRNEEALVMLEDEHEAAYLKKKYGFIPPDDWVLFDGLLNGYCPLVSTGDNPRHALKYGYGMKFYAGHYHERLKPSWDAEGRARRPYIGKVYASLHTLEDYIEDAPNHVPSMNLYGRITVGDAIADEREATFPAYVPGDRTVIEHVAKIPSFMGERPEDGYGDAHLYKYGLDPEDFAELHELLRKAQAADAKADKQAKSEEDKKGKKGKKGKNKNAEHDEDEPDEEPESAVDWFLQRVCAWLVNYQEVRLVEVARRIALARGRLLVYRNSLGELDRTLSSTVVAGVRLPGNRGLESQDPMELRSLRRYVYTTDSKNKQAIIDKERSTWSKPRRELRERLTEDYTVHETPGDGNCLFHALAGILRVLGLRSLDHRALRGDVVYNMGEPAYAGIRQQYALDQAYLDEMAQTCTDPGQLGRWGGDPEIHAFCWRFQVRVRVYAPTNPGPEHYTEFNPEFHVIPRAVGYLLHVHGNHWEYLRPK